MECILYLLGPVCFELFFLKKLSKVFCFGGFFLFLFDCFFVFLFVFETAFESASTLYQIMLSGRKNVVYLSIQLKV